MSLRALYSTMLKAKGVGMNKIKAVRGNGNGSASSIPSCFDAALKPHHMYVLVSNLEQRINYQLAMFFTDSSGNVYRTLRFDYSTADNMQMNSATWSGTVSIAANTEFAEIDISQWKFVSV